MAKNNKNKNILYIKTKYKIYIKYENITKKKES